MKCRQAQDLIGAYIYGDLAPEEMRDLRLHTHECAVCREDLESRGRVVSALDDSIPTLTDEERLRIAWSVKGAVRKEQYERKPFALKLIPTLALAGALVAGVVVGRYVITRSHPSHGQVAKAAPPANVRVKELPAPATDAKSDKATNELSALLQSLANPVGQTGTFLPPRNTSQGRAWLPERHNLVSPDSVFVVPDNKMPQVRTSQPPAPDTNMVNPPKDSAPAATNSQAGTDSEQSTQLPRVTDPKNAETTPSDNK